MPWVQGLLAKDGRTSASLHGYVEIAQPLGPEREQTPRAVVGREPRTQLGQQHPAARDARAQAGPHPHASNGGWSTQGETPTAAARGKPQAGPR